MENQAPQIIQSISPEDQAQIDQAVAQDAQTELKYGEGHTLESAALGAARGATFGLSDQALTSKKLGKFFTGKDEALYTPEDLKQLKELHGTASTVGEVAGVVGTLPLKASPVGAAASIGTNIELKTLGKLLAETGSESLAKQVLKKGIAKAAGSAVEGSFYGLGQLISENALGEADFNAENVVASMGSGAILGGALGGAMGVAEPLISKVKIPSLFSSSEPEKDALKIMGITTPAKTAKVMSRHPERVADLPTFIANDLKFKPSMNNEQKYEVLSKFKDDVGRKIGNTTDAIDSAIEKDTFLKSTMPTKKEFAFDMARVVENYAKKYDIAPTREIYNQIMTLSKNFELEAASKGASTTQLTYKDINKYRMAADKMSKWDVDQTKNAVAKANQHLRQVLADYMDEKLANAASPELATQLKALNKQYSMAATFEPDLQKAVYHEPKAKDNWAVTKLAGLGEMAAHALGLPAGVGLIPAAATKLKEGLDSNWLRTFKVLNYVEKSNQQSEKTIANTVKNFIAKNKEKAEPILTNQLLQTSLAKPELTKKSKAETKEQAYNQIKGNLETLHADTSSYMNRLADSVKDLQQSAPQTHIGTIAVLQRAQQFLLSKMPQELKAKGVLDKSQYKPNSVELAKFSRYVEAVEHPLTAIKQIQNGVFSPETAEALQTVYPNLFTKLQNTFMDYISSGDVRLDYKQKILISNVLKIPAESSFNNLAALQATYSNKDMQKANQKLTKLNMNVDNFKSGTERIVTRK